MTVEIRTGQARAVTRAEGRTTWHSFSFGAHYDPTNVSFGALVAHNDELLPPGTGYAEHPHADLEIVTWVLEGALRHTSDVPGGGSGTVVPGRVQRLSAGSGVRHSEVTEPGVTTRFLQAWVRPDEPGTVPHHLVADVDLGPGWTCVAGGASTGAAVPIGTRGASLHVADLAAGDGLDLPDAPLLHVFTAAGQVMLGERRLAGGDAARLADEGGRRVRAEQDAHLVVWALEPTR